MIRPNPEAELQAFSPMSASGSASATPLFAKCALGKPQSSRPPEALPIHIVELLSARLRQWRETRRIPLKRMAADLNVSISIVSAWENGTRFPCALHLEQLSAYTGIPVCRFFCDCLERCGEPSIPLSTICGKIGTAR